MKFKASRLRSIRKICRTTNKNRDAPLKIIKEFSKNKQADEDCKVGLTLSASCNVLAIISASSLGNYDSHNAIPQNLLLSNRQKHRREPSQTLINRARVWGRRGRSRQRAV